MDTRLMSISYLAVTLGALSSSALNARMNLIQIVSRRVSAMACRATKLAVCRFGEILLNEVVEKLRAAWCNRATSCCFFGLRFCASPKERHESASVAVAVETDFIVHGYRLALLSIFRACRLSIAQARHQQN